MTYPAQEKVWKLIRENGFVVQGGVVYAGPVKLSDVAIARVAGVDRRMVKLALKNPEATEAG